MGNSNNVMILKNKNNNNYVAPKSPSCVSLRVQSGLVAFATNGFYINHIVVLIFSKPGANETLTRTKYLIINK